MDTRPNPVASDDIERLGSCLGLLVADGGEAENAARAARTIARRLGLSGGQLKQMFIAGAAVAPDGPVGVHDAADELAGLRRQLSATEIARVAARREVEFLDRQNASLRQGVDEAGASAKRWRVAAIAASLLFAAGFVVVALRPQFTAPRPQVSRPTQDTSPFGRAAVVRSGGATLYDAPDNAAPGRTPLPAGAHLIVRRLLWKTLQQWAEVEVELGGRTGYVVTTGIDMP